MQSFFKSMDSIFDGDEIFFFFEKSYSIDLFHIIWSLNPIHSTYLVEYNSINSNVSKFKLISSVKLLFTVSILEIVGIWNATKLSAINWTLHEI